VKRIADILIVAGLLLCASMLRAQDTAARITVGSGKTHLIDTEVNIERVSVAEPGVAEAVPVTARSLMVNGKAPGETSLVLWLDDGTRREYDVNVRMGQSRIEAAQQQIESEFEGRVHMVVDATAVYLTGTVKDIFQSHRAEAIVEPLGRVVNLLHVEVPPQETQILLKVRFANVDRTKSRDLGINFVGVPHGFPFSVRTGAYPSGAITSIGQTSNGNVATATLSDALNLLFWDPQIDVGATLKDLEGKAILQILAEPNLLAMNGHEASFVAGGEFPFPTIQGGASGVGQITIQFRQFGVQIKFLPTITPRGTIRLHVAPEVSALDYANALTVQGYTIPALNTRKVDTEVELETGQTFAIAGLLDQRTTESFSRIPGLADIPVLGKLFTSKGVTASNSELLVIVTPELVAPADAKDTPTLPQPLNFMSGNGIMNDPPRTPGVETTGPAAVKPQRDQLPVQELEKYQTDVNRGLSGGSQLSTGGGYAPSSGATSIGSGSTSPGSAGAGNGSAAGASSAAPGTGAQ
jgi:pilus assembly protein CpaC